jgi:hypothetical protein
VSSKLLLYSRVVTERLTPPLMKEEAPFENPYLGKNKNTNMGPSRA